MSPLDSCPRITIITPSYNQGEFIEETIKSVLNQKYPNLEYFVIDGGSTDNTLDIIKKYEHRIDWWVSEPDGGQSHAINKGLTRATGEILNWINSDDLLFPGALRHVANAYVECSGDVHLIVGATARISKEGRIIKVSSPPSRRALSPKAFIIPIGQQSSFFTKSAIQHIGLLREDLHAIMDMDLYYRILKMGGKFVRIRTLIGAIRNQEKAKGFAQRHLWVMETPNYLKEIRVSPFRQFWGLAKMRIVRMLDMSYLCTYFLSKILLDKTINGDGLELKDSWWLKRFTKDNI
jgi:glycosyltransferase involved in cell wall biosynthesis